LRPENQTSKNWVLHFYQKLVKCSTVL